MNTALAFSLLGLGQLVEAGCRVAPREGVRRRDPVLAWLLLVFAVLAAGLVAAGRYSYRRFERHYRAEVQRQLAAIADLKVSELLLWRHERLGDGAIFRDNVNFSDLLQRCIEAPADRVARERARIWLGRMREAKRYERAVLLDAAGTPLAASPESAEPGSASLRSAVATALQSGEVTFLDLHRGGPGLPVHLSVLVPIRAARNPSRLLGVLVLGIDPAASLFPILKRWPTPARTAETLIARREGDEVVFLNELRFDPNAALALRRPLADERLPAARAVLGQVGAFEGVDYRGVEVISELRPVPGSPWALVTRIDAAEAFAPLTLRLWLLVLGVAILLFASAAALAFVWHRSAARFYRERAKVAEALAASDAELRQRTDELTRFTYAVSHDLKSPLVTIQTFLGYLERDLGGEPAAARKDIAFIRTAAQKMSRLLDELLELSRVGRARSRPEDVALQAAVDEALALVAGRVASRGARVEVTREPIVLHGERARLVEVFQNLVDNAVKFMGDQAAPLVEIGVDGPGPEPVLYVRDNGAGIDPRHLAKLFGLFEKLDPKSEGTGMGLALVRRIVEVHGGRIWAESAGPGCGACFRFTLAGTRRGHLEEAPR
jgi:signal transduction histidine kinase